jgi:hypothetical protein
MTNKPENLSNRDIQALMTRANRERSALAHRLIWNIFHSIRHAWRSYTAPKPLGDAT